MKFAPVIRMQFAQVCSQPFIETDLHAAVVRRAKRMSELHPQYPDDVAEEDLAVWYQEMLKGEREAAPLEPVELAAFVMAHEPEYVWVALLAVRELHSRPTLEHDPAFQLDQLKRWCYGAALDLNHALLPMLELYDDRTIVQTAARRGLAIAEKLLLLGRSVITQGREP